MGKNHSRYAKLQEPPAYVEATHFDKTVATDAAPETDTRADRDRADECAADLLLMRGLRDHCQDASKRAVTMEMFAKYALRLYGESDPEFVVYLTTVLDFDTYDLSKERLVVQMLLETYAHHTVSAGALKLILRDVIESSEA